VGVLLGFRVSSSGFQGIKIHVVSGSWSLRDGESGLWVGGWGLGVEVWGWEVEV